MGVRDERGAGTTAATGPQVRAYGLTLVVGALATLVNPYGLGLWEHIVTYSGGSFTTGLIAEFQPPNFRQPITWGFLLLLAGALVVLARTWRRVPLIHLLLLAGWTALAFQAARNILPFSVLVPALLAPQLAYLLNRAPRPGPAPFWVRYRVVGPIRQGFPWLLAGTLAGLLALAALGGRVGGVGVLHAAWTEPPFPIRAVHFLQATPPAGKMFNDITWGGYLLDALYPRRQVFISSQQDAYGDALNRAYLTAEFTLPGWEQVLADYDIGWVIDTPGSRLVQALRARPERWQVLYADTTAVVLTRR